MTLQPSQKKISKALGYLRDELVYYIKDEWYGTIVDDRVAEIDAKVAILEEALGIKIKRKA